MHVKAPAGVPGTTTRPGMAALRWSCLKGETSKHCGCKEQSAEHQQPGTSQDQHGSPRGPWVVHLCCRRGRGGGGRGRRRRCWCYQGFRPGRSRGTIGQRAFGGNRGSWTGVSGSSGSHYGRFRGRGGRRRLYRRMWGRRRRGRCGRSCGGGCWFRCGLVGAARTADRDDND